MSAVINKAEADTFYMSNDWQAVWENYLNSKLEPQSTESRYNAKYLPPNDSIMRAGTPYKSDTQPQLLSFNLHSGEQKNDHEGHVSDQSTTEITSEANTVSPRASNILWNQADADYATFLQASEQTVCDDLIVRYGTPSIDDNEIMCQIRATEDIPYIPNEAFIEVKGVHGQTVIKSYHCVFPKCSKSTII
jgi:hypothetical protein